jgi:hypothetical protein
MRTLFAPISLIALIAGSSPAGAQWSDAVRPFAAGAVLAGPLGFARPPITTVFGGGYAYAPAWNFLVGAQGGTAIANTRGSDATFALATVGYAQSRGARWQFYPYVSFGTATLRPPNGSGGATFAFGGGFGAEILTGSANPSGLLGARIGYITRNANDDASVAFAALSIGLGGRLGGAPITVVHRNRSNAQEE